MGLHSSKLGVLWCSALLLAVMKLLRVLKWRGDGNIKEEMNEK